jgi:hypothetical protein
MADQKLMEAARLLLKQLGGPSDKFVVGVLDTTTKDGQEIKTILLYGYETDLKQLNAPLEFMGYEVGWAPSDEAMGT